MRADRASRAPVKYNPQLKLGEQGFRQRECLAAKSRQRQRRRHREEGQGSKRKRVNMRAEDPALLQLESAGRQIQKGRKDKDDNSREVVLL